MIFTKCAGFLYRKNNHGALLLMAKHYQVKMNLCFQLGFIVGAGILNEPSSLVPQCNGVFIKASIYFFEENKSVFGYNNKKKAHQRMMVDPMFMIVKILRSFLTAVTPTAVTPTGVAPTAVILLEFT